MRRLVNLLLLSAGVMSSAAAPRSDRPNILLVVAGNLGREWLGCYGGQEIATPNIDRLANGGTRFETCYASSHGTVSLNVLLTGRYPFRNGWMWHNDAPKWGPPYLDWNRERTFARHLQDAGYVTAYAGEWILNDLDKQTGALANHGFGRRLAGANAESAIGFLTAIQERPFLLLLKTGSKPADYRLGVHELDQTVGRLIKALEDLELNRQTIVMFTSESGSAASVARAWGRQVRGGQGKMTDVGINVPLIVSGTYRVRRGQVIRELVDFSDVFPTLIELAGGRLPRDQKIDGRSFAGLLKGQPGVPREWIFSQYGSDRVIRNAQYKLYSNGRLYNLLGDPLEENNLARANVSEAIAERERLNVLLNALPEDAPLNFPYARRLMIRRR